MVENSLSAAGFLLLIIADFLWTKGKNVAKELRNAGYLLVGAAVLLFALAPDPWWPLEAPAGAASFQPGASPSPLGAALLILIIAASCILLFWSVFLEISIVKRKRGLGPDSIVSSGTYRWCRHPGFWWFATLMVAIGAMRGFSGYYLTILLLIALDLLLIFIQDRYTFPKVFCGYEAYKKSVPFLIPRIGARWSRRD
ncbi:MAG: hypothetical protein WC820_04595 [Spirochaetales bacterium]|jgi:protein-S-isoprenylcysteine O-methyltransferase Ste14